MHTTVHTIAISCSLTRVEFVVRQQAQGEREGEDHKHRGKERDIRREVDATPVWL